RPSLPTGPGIASRLPRSLAPCLAGRSASASDGIGTDELPAGPALTIPPTLTASWSSDLPSTFQITSHKSPPFFVLRPRPFVQLFPVTNHQSRVTAFVAPSPANRVLLFVRSPSSSVLSPSCRTESRVPMPPPQAARHAVTIVTSSLPFCRRCCTMELYNLSEGAPCRPL